MATSIPSTLTQVEDTTSNEPGGGQERRGTTAEEDPGERRARRRMSMAVSLEQSMVSNSDAPYLPQEIFTYILKRLPVKSLIRFQCVCKDWKNLFKTPSSIAEHVRHSTQQDSVLLFKSLGYKCNPKHLCLINRDMQVLEYQTPPSSVRRRDIIGSSNGLLCLCLMYKSSFILWNPTTREVVRVPKVPNLNHNGISDVGFGFSPIINDYKIVRLCLSRLDDVRFYLVQVFSVSKRSWTEVEVGKLKGIMPFVAPGFSFDGAIFWFGFGCEPRVWGRKRRLISFNIATESFALIQIPKSARVTSWTRLTTYEDKLAMLSQSWGQYKRGIESAKSFSISLWVMGKCVDTSRERWIWTKIYTSNPFPDPDRTYFLRPLTIWRNEIVIVGVTKDETVLVFCNLHTNLFKMLPMGKYTIGTVIWNYAESLVLVPDIHIETSSS